MVSGRLGNVPPVLRQKCLDLESRLLIQSRETNRWDPKNMRDSVSKLLKFAPGIFDSVISEIAIDQASEMSPEASSNGEERRVASYH